MIEKLYLGLILVFFILAFAIRNIKTFLTTKQSIKGKSTKLTLSILISTLIYLLIILRIAVVPPEYLIEFDIKFSLLTYAGYVVVFVGFVLGILALITMRNSWRVGIKYEQKTDLVDTGIYRLSRNPYFLSYDILIFGYVLIFPSIILFMLLITLAIIFHNMILEEEKYLKTVHGEKYEKYKTKVNRYLTLK